jgi:hypothetical protein
MKPTNGLQFVVLLIIFTSFCTYAGVVSFGITPRVEINLTDIPARDVVKGWPLILEGKVINVGNVPVEVSPMAFIKRTQWGSLVKTAPYKLMANNGEGEYLACLDTRDLAVGSYSAKVVIPYYNEYYSGFVEKEYYIDVQDGVIADDPIIDLLTFDNVKGAPGSIQVADVNIKNNLDYTIDTYLFSKNDQDVIGCMRMTLAAGEIRREKVAVMIPYEERNVTIVVMGKDGYSNERTLKVSPKFPSTPYLGGNDTILIMAVLPLFIIVLHVSKKRCLKRFEEAEKERQDMHIVDRKINSRSRRSHT